MIDLKEIRAEYPILDRKIYDRPLVYLDSAATSQTPRCVLDSINDMYTTKKANVHRGVHTLSQEATEMQEIAREKVRAFINAASTQEIIFTRGTTESINLVASSFGDKLCNGDEIILTVMEHHSNIVPWQLLQKRKRINIRVVPMNDKGELRTDIFEDMFTDNTRLVPVLVDGAQSTPHIRVDVQDLDADFYAFSAHKMYGPTGVGVLYGKKKWLESMTPYQGGGEMIGHVSFEKTTFAELPFKFEAGTPDFVGIAAFGAAIDYMERIGVEQIEAHEHALLQQATEGLMKIPEMRIFGNAAHKSGVISFLVGNIHHYDMGMLLDKLGVAVRTGHHCAQPLMTSLGIEGTVRASFGVYNTPEEVDTFVAAVARVAKMF